LLKSELMKSLKIVLASAVVLLLVFAMRARIFPLPMPTITKSAEIASKQLAHLILGTEAQKLSRDNGLINDSAPGLACCRISDGFTLEQLCGADGSIKISESAKLARDQECTCLHFFYCRLVIVTAASSNHYAESQDMIGSVQKFLPNTKLIVYDLGLTRKQKETLHRYCNLEVRPFRHENYPPHTNILTTYAWKPLVINEVASRYEVVFWGDTSVRLRGDSFAEKIFPFLLKFPFVAGSVTELPIVSLTHDGMLKYLNLSLSRKQMGNFGHLEANCWVMWVNNLMHSKFLNYWVDCALHQECIDPHGATLWNCDLKIAKKGTGVYTGCHRFDQSALDMILIREFGLGVWDSVVHKDSLSLFQVNRRVTHNFTVKQC